MTSLTKVAIVTRRVIRYSIYLIIFGIILRIVIGMGIGVYKKLFPPPPPAPTVAFGKLPKLEFPENKDLPQITYSIETAEGDFPKLKDQAKVYYMPKISSSLLALDSAKRKAAGIGFTSEPEQISDSVYRFSNPSSPQKLDMNIITGIFSLSYDLATDPSPLSVKPPTPEIAASQVRSYLSSGGFLAKDLTGEVNHEFLKTELQNLVPALSLSEANLIRISLFRKSFDEIPTVTSDPIKGNIWFLVSGGTIREKQIIAGEYHYFPVDETQFSTYPLKTSQIAYEALKSGKTYIANLGQNKDGKVTIRRIYLGYFDGDTPSQFMQPVVVFEGDRSFKAYVPAVTDAYINSQ
ncbi:hypothetical protein KW795_01060 [Candidatus Microgenomates bacterium]|nr:hypothetical protein [Candidatus Microgenomates bacterium]